MMIRIWLQLALKIRLWLRLDLCAGRVRIAEVAGDTVDRGIHCLKRTEHVVEGAVFHHENNDVLELIQTGRHSHPQIQEAVNMLSEEFGNAPPRKFTRCVDALMERRKELT